MPNGYFNKQVGVPLSSGKGLDGTGFLADTAAEDRAQRATPSMPMKTGFGNPGIPGKTQSKDRSGGVKRAKTRPEETGL